MIVLIALVGLSVFVSEAQAQSLVARWWEPYSGEDVNGGLVLGFWRFDSDGAGLLADSSSRAHAASERGAIFSAEGRFGGGLQSGAGWPVQDVSHSIHVKSAPDLSPASAFTLEMWIQLQNADGFPEGVNPVLMDSKYVASSHAGFLWSLAKAPREGNRQLAIEIGMGSRSEKWFSRPFAVEPLKWQHVALSYDSLGTVTFYVDGQNLGKVTKPDAGPMARSNRQLAIGDRSGSLYNGFPGTIDEVRITAAELDFRPLRFESGSLTGTAKKVLERMSDSAVVRGELVNQTGQRLANPEVYAEIAGVTTRLPFTELLPGTQSVQVPIDTTLKPGEYDLKILVTLPEFYGRTDGYRTALRIPVAIKPRPLPLRMPVVMWGIGGTEGVLKEMSRLKEIGFTHCLGLRADMQKIWDEQASSLPGSDLEIQAGREMLDAALDNDVRIVVPLSPGSWLRRAEVGRPFLRIDRNGNHYGREDISGLFQPVQDFCFNVGSAVGKAYGDHPALDGALLHTEVRGASQVSFHSLEVEAFRAATGLGIPSEVTVKNGVQYQKLPDFPADRVIPDDHPILQYLAWFWTRGDGWNNLSTQLHKGLKQEISRENFWTFYDPAVRVPSIGSSGGEVDVVSHWTYSYPDPVRIGLCTDELFEMARSSGRHQDVMKMTQLIWYRSQTAPINAAAEAERSPWVDQDPDAAYITIAPMHLREAFWWKIARPIRGIMYHGWQSLVETDHPGAYRHTNPNTRSELQRLVKTVAVPLGPTLLQIPDAESDVVFLESFTSQMFARRGTYGWNRSWAGDMYHILMYSQLQPRVMYEESLLAGGLNGAKVLVMADCDVLTESVAQAIRKFQAQGGLIVADAEVCPGITPDFTLQRFSRTKQANVDRNALQAAAVKLRTWLDQNYSRSLDSSNPDVVTRRRVFGTTDYLFAVNDAREFGTYVGNYDLVMEDGLPSQTTLSVARNTGFVYDLLSQQQLNAATEAGHLKLPLQLGPCDGRLLMVTQRPIREVTVTAPEVAERGQTVDVGIAVTDGESALDAVIPVHVKVTDPEGVPGEFTGYYGAADGRLRLSLTFAPNDRSGLWQIHVRELASGKSASGYIRLKQAD